MISTRYSNSSCIPSSGALDRNDVVLNSCTYLQNASCRLAGRQQATAANKKHDDPDAIRVINKTSKSSDRVSAYSGGKVQPSTLYEAERVIEEHPTKTLLAVIMIPVFQLLMAMSRQHATLMVNLNSDNRDAMITSVRKLSYRSTGTYSTNPEKRYPRVIELFPEPITDLESGTPGLRGFSKTDKAFNENLSTTDPSLTPQAPSTRQVEPMSIVPSMQADDAWTSPITCPSVAGSQDHKTCTRPELAKLPPIANCGDMHGMDLHQSVVDGALMSEDARFTAQPLAQGGTRQVWKLRDQSQDSSFVLKTLLMDRSFDAFDCEMQMIDALAMERLTKSPYTVNIYGFCGQSSINEFATKVGSHVFKDKHLSEDEKLRFAIDIAQGVADVHSIASEPGSELAIIHNDLSSSNFVLVDPKGPVKLNDFNVAQLQCWDSQQDSPCGYFNPEEFGGEGRRRVDVRAPEELMGKPLTEKIDVYGVGSMLYFLMTGKRMYSLEERELTDDEKRSRIIASTPPSLPSSISKSESREIRVIHHAMMLALQATPADRPTAQELADTLRQGRQASEDLSESSPAMFVAGLVRDIQKIPQRMIDQIIELNCKYGIGVHILSDSEPNLSFIEEKREGFHGNCAPFLVLLRNHTADMADFPNRIERIAHLRDAQREHLRTFLSKTTTDLEQSAVMLVDMDLAEIPSNEILVDEFIAMRETNDHDVVCAGGRMYNPPGYYDTFATVLLPGTFVYPLEGRLVETPMPGENRASIRSDDTFGEFTQKDLLDHFEELAKEYPEGTVPLRSCFGGLALYRASTWLTQTCRYSLDSKSLMGFANKADGRPCEHVVFNNCLLESNPSTYIAVKPSLETYWDEPVKEINTMFPSGEITSGLVRNDGLVTLAEDPSTGYRLRNGAFVARIDHSGSLAVEEDPGDLSNANPIWKAELQSNMFQENWTKAFLLMEANGLLKVIHQVKGIKSGMGPLDCIEVNKPNITALELLDGFDRANTLCRIEVWNSGTAGLDSSSHSLVLEDDGELTVQDTTLNRVVWSNRGRVGVRKELSSISAKAKGSRPCIPSGDERSIVEALNQGPGSEAVLCQGAIFELKSTIRMESDYQKIYTEGRPTDDQRAILRVADPKVVTAITMKGTSFTEVRNVIVDGNRPGYGSVLANVSPTSGGGLLVAGGRTAFGQIVSNVKAFEPRSWSALHIAEGEGEEGRCRNVIIENNELGPAGRDHGHHNPIADGISFACTEGLVRNNTVVDATDGAIVLFGAPGTVVEGNTIVARTQNLLGGINLVDFAPYNGNYTGTIVRNNVIRAEGAMINIGLGMGLKIWTCRAPDEDIDLFGGTVIDNRLEGDHMGYGYAISGVRNWTATGNIDTSKHRGVPLVDCKGQIPSPPAAFQIDSSSSRGTFQEEFQDAKLDSITLTFRDNKAYFAPKHHLKHPNSSSFWLNHHQPVSQVDQGSVTPQTSNEASPSLRQCIPSGDGTAIQEALRLVGDEAVLCPGAVFDLKRPIEFTRDYQKLYTQGLPTNGQRAILRVADPSMATAVSMVGVSDTHLQNVVVDGNRVKFGYISPQEVSYSSGALIAAGGNGVSTQTISGIHAFDPRSWSCLQVQEGDLSFRCERMTVQDNEFGPMGDEAGGMSFACTDSSVRNNKVLDATDVGISIHGAPGSIFEGNEIISRENSLRAGITMVDVAPFEGDFTNTIVRKNIIAASGANIGVGMAMGSRIWGCPSEDASIPLLFGARVLENQLEGSHMGYGLAVDGVKNWHLVDNKDFSTHVGTPTQPCNGVLPSPPQGFQLSQKHSSGNFQPEFVESTNLDAIVNSLSFP